MGRVPSGCLVACSKRVPPEAWQGLGLCCPRKAALKDLLNLPQVINMLSNSNERGFHKLTWTEFRASLNNADQFQCLVLTEQAEETILSETRRATAVPELALICKPVINWKLIIHFKKLCQGLIKVCICQCYTEALCSENIRLNCVLGGIRY